MIFFSYIIALCGGLLPVLLWLWFWEHEDKNPEPTKLIIYAFFGGVLAVFIAIPLEKIVLTTFGDPSVSVLTTILWAAIEELTKFVLAYIIVLRRMENDEPIDNFMYLITVALGFAALENALFIAPYFIRSDFVTGLAVVNFRFLGATMLHTISSGSIGILLGLAYYKSKKVKFAFLIIGIVIAILLHTLFNLGIVEANETSAIIPFFAVWLGTVVVVISLERVKQLQNKLL